MKKLYYVLFIIFIHLSIHCKADLAYVANQMSNTVSVIDTSTNTVIITIMDSSFQNPTSIAIAPNRQFALVTNRFSGNSVSEIDLTTNTVVNTFTSMLNDPLGIAITPDSAFAYVANFNSNLATVINLSNSNAQTITVGSFPTELAVTPNGKFVYVSSPIDNNISVIQTSNNMVINTIPFTGSPQFISFRPDGAFAYVALANLITGVAVIDTSNYNIVTTLPLSGSFTGPVNVLVRPHANTAYATFNNSGMFSIAVIDTQTNTVSTTSILLASTQFSEGMAFTADGKFLYITLSNSNSVLVVDPDTLAVINTISVGIMPWGIAIPLAQQPSSLQPPASIRGKQLKNDFGLQYEQFNLLQWEPSTTSNISGYRIYRNNILIATVDSATLEYRDHTRKKHKAYRYSVVTFSPTGESSPAMITIP